MLRAFLIPVALLFASCAQFSKPPTAESIASGTTKTEDPFTGLDTISSPAHGDPIFGGHSAQLLYILDHHSLTYSGPFLRLTHYRSHTEPTIALFPRAARDIEGHALRLMRGDQQVEEYGTYEYTTILLPPGYLERHRTGGSLIRLYGAEGRTMDIEIPAALIAGFADGAVPLLREHGIPEGTAPTPPP
jgi:hypothetical protein